MNESRNWKIYWEWIDGKEYMELADEFGLAKSTIKDICISLVPVKVRNMQWQRLNSYKRFREWKRKQPRNHDRLNGNSTL